jgi:hypothetical protein
MLDRQTFKTVIDNTLLAPIDLCLVCNSQIFMGQRTSEPLGFSGMPGSSFSPRVNRFL